MTAGRDPVTPEDIAFLREQGLRQLWAGIGDAVAAEKKRRRAMVLAHPDLAERLTQPPLGFTRPEQWCGYVAGEVWQHRRNTSPRRAALVAIVTEAEARAAQGRAA